MKLRGVLLALFLLPLAWGLLTLARGVVVPDAPRCPGVTLGPDGEEHPGPMRPTDTCGLVGSVYRQSTGTRTYHQQIKAQIEDRERYYRQGAAYAAYGLAGLAVLAPSFAPYRLPWRRTAARQG